MVPPFLRGKSELGRAIVCLGRAGAGDRRLPFVCASRSRRSRSSHLPSLVFLISKHKISFGYGKIRRKIKNGTSVLAYNCLDVARA